MNEIFFALIVFMNPVTEGDIKYIEPVYFDSKYECEQGLKRGLEYITTLPEYDDFKIQGKCIQFFPTSEWM